MVRANKRNEALRIESALLNKIAMLGTEKTAEAVGVDKSQISRWKRDWITPDDGGSCHLWLGRGGPPAVNRRR
ncbi:hypothetical protein A8395_004706 [Escherichia coli]|nr:hypothetical protein [Escherichia coli]